MEAEEAVVEEVLPSRSLASKELLERSHHLEEVAVVAVEGHFQSQA